MTTKTARKTQIKILEKYCKGCGLCVTFCKKGVLAQEGPINEMGYQTIIVKAPEKCTLCKNCVVMCPDAAIEVQQEDE